MGFFSKLLGGALKIGGSLLGFGGGTAAPAVVAAPATSIVRKIIQKPLVRTIARGTAAVGGAVGLGAAFAGGEALVDADGQAIPGALGGNGLTVRRTIVQTINRETGDVVRSQVLRGAPFIMRNDIQIAKRVIRTASKLGRMKGIRHSVKQSMSSRLKEALDRKVLAAATGDPC